MPEHGPDRGSPGSVLFLAVGGNRQRATVAESTLVVDAGGRARLVVADAEAWRRSGLRPQVTLTAVSGSGLPPLLAWLDQALGSALPRLGVRVLGRGPLRAWAQRASVGYQRRVAAPLHRRLLTRFPTRNDLTRNASAAPLIRRLGGVAFDCVVVCDAASMPVAAHLVRYYASRGRTSTICYGLDDIGAVPAGDAARLSLTTPGV
jgi:hypothetical protein